MSSTTEPTLTRVVRFAAVHRYWRPDWSEERNRATFGAQAHSHGQDFRVEVTVGGPPDPDTGWVVELAALDAVLDEVLGPLRGGDLNTAIPEVRRGEILPSTEALAAWLWTRLDGRIPGAASLRRVRFWEGYELGSEVSSVEPPPRGRPT
jgi:6-pyruvoyltetrahydropterin/6-carboxytetrahydropterin synthase